MKINSCVWYSIVVKIGVSIDLLLGILDSCGKICIFVGTIHDLIDINRIREELKEILAHL